jgi:hypothetical protein
MRNSLLRASLTLLKSLFVVMLVVLPTSVVILARDQAQAAVPTQIYSIGIAQADGTVLYSILFYSGPDALSKLTITSTVPQDSTLAEVVIAPSSARLAADSATKTTLKWEIEKVEARTVLGPFMYRIKFAAAAKQTPPNVPAQASWQVPGAGTVEAKVLQGALKPLAETGKITFDAKGTINDKGEPIAVQVGETGIWIYVPKDVVAQSVELTFTRIGIDADSVPKEIKDIWWCALVKIEANPAVKLAKPMLIGLPTRQILTTGMGVQALTGTNTGDVAWKALPTVQGMRIGGYGNLAEVIITDTIPAMLAVGVNSSRRSDGTASIPPGNPNYGQGTVISGFQGGVQQSGGQGGFQGGFQGFNFGFGGFQGFQGAQIGGCQGGFQGGFQGGQGGGFQGGFGGC